MRNDQYCGKPFHSLEGQGLLLFQFPASTFPPVQGGAVPVLGLDQAPLCALDLVIYICQRSPDLLVRPAEDFGEGKFHVLGNPPQIVSPVLPDFLDER